MKYPAHVVGGLTFGVAANQYVVQHLPIIEHHQLSSIVISSVFIAGSVFGSLLPDIDHRGSYLGRRLPILSFLANATMGGHRGATHAPFITVALTTLFVLITNYFVNGIFQLFCLILLAGCMTGALSHIFLDSLTKSGVPLLYPFSKRHYRLASLTTGGIGEILVTLLMILVVVWMSTGNFSSGIKSLFQV
ncbi:metal-dependent hydrolase (plasmid) [Brevibacillus halotolerans]|nr:metal-dependent hydrolase [Brevibacillus halotolerans]